MMNSKSHIRFDWAVKKILRSKANYGILEGFLSELFQEDVKIKSLLSEEGNKETHDDKHNRIDILIENSKGEIIIVEIQNTRELDYIYRVLYGTSKVITEYMKEGSPYSMVRKVITISIVYFNFGQGKDYLYKGETKFEGLNQHDIFELSDEQKAIFNKKSVSDIFPFHYLIRVNQFDDVAKNTIDQWIYFFKNSEIPTEFKAKGLDEAREKLKTVTMTREQLAEYDRYLDNLHFDASIAQTINFDVEYEKQKALKRQKILIATELLKNKVDKEIVRLSTELSQFEIDEIGNQLNE